MAASGGLIKLMLAAGTITPVLSLLGVAAVVAGAGLVLRRHEPRSDRVVVPAARSSETGGGQRPAVSASTFASLLAVIVALAVTCGMPSSRTRLLRHAAHRSVAARSGVVGCRDRGEPGKVHPSVTTLGVDDDDPPDAVVPTDRVQLRHCLPSGPEQVQLEDAGVSERVGRQLPAANIYDGKTQTSIGPSDGGDRRGARCAARCEWHRGRGRRRGIRRRGREQATRSAPNARSSRRLGSTADSARRDPSSSTSRMVIARSSVSAPRSEPSRACRRAVRCEDGEMIDPPDR